MRIVGLATWGLLSGCPSQLVEPDLVLQGEGVVHIDSLGAVAAPAVHLGDEPAEVTWEGGPSGVVAIRDNGIRAVGPGEALIVGHYEDQTVEWTLVVAPSIAIRLGPSPGVIRVGTTVQLDAHIDGDGPELVWSSSDPAIASVAGLGEVTGHSPGMVYISVNAGAAGAMMEVVVEP